MSGQVVRKGGEERFEALRSIRVRGANEHNLKGVDVELPRDREGCARMVEEAKYQLRNL